MKWFDEWKVSPLTIKEVAERSGLKYHTARNYTIALQKRGISLSAEVIPVLGMIAKLTSEGMGIDAAVDQVVSTDEKSLTMIQIMEKVSSLEKQIDTQNQLLQVYLSKIDRLETQIQKALPKPEDEKKPIWYRIKSYFVK